MLNLFRLVSIGLMAGLSFETAAQSIPADEAAFTDFFVQAIRPSAGDAVVTIKCPLAVYVGPWRTDLTKVFNYCQSNKAGCLTEIDKFSKNVEKSLKEHNAPLDANNLLGPNDIARDYQQCIIRPLKLEGKPADIAVRKLVELGLRCKLAPEKEHIFSTKSAPKYLPAYISCEKKLGEEFDGYPWLSVNVTTDWRTDGRKVSELFAHLESASVTGLNVSGMNPFYTQKNPAIARKAQQDLDEFAVKNPMAGTAAEVVNKLIVAGFYCGINKPNASAVANIVCSSHWPTDTCRLGMVELSISGPSVPASDVANLMWSTAHSVSGSRWSCPDPTDSRQRDIKTFIFGTPRK